MKRFLFLFMTALAAGWMSESTQAAPLQLLTAKEAAEPDLPVPKGGKPSDVFQAKPPVPGAPQIIVDKPAQGIGVKTPFAVKIRFLPNDGARINLNSLEIDVVKLVRISLLDRVKPYLSAAGINVPEAVVPSGTYNIRIAIADDQGRLGVTTQTWTIL